MKIGVELDGISKIEVMLKNVIPSDRAQLSALFRQAQKTLTKAKKRCPKDTGALAASGRVVIYSDRTVGIQFGGDSAPYAVPVHERLGVHHPNGEAKFLESAMLEDIDLFGRALQEAMGKK